MIKKQIGALLCLSVLATSSLFLSGNKLPGLQAKTAEQPQQERTLPISSKKNLLTNDKLLQLPDLSGFTESETVLEQVIETESGEEMAYFVGPSRNIGQPVTKLVSELNGQFLQITQPNMTKVDERGRRVQHIYGGETSLQTSTNLLMAVTPPGETPAPGTVYEPVLSNKTTADDFSYSYKVAKNGLKTFKVTYKTKSYSFGEGTRDWPPADFPADPLEINMVISGLPTGFAVVDYYVTNTSNQPIENFSLMKTVDTQLGFDDRVIPRAMGDDLGVYIDNHGDKLYYIFNDMYTKQPPENWLGSKFSGKVGHRLFGPLNSSLRVHLLKQSVLAAKKG